VAELLNYTNVVYPGGEVPVIEGLHPDLQEAIVVSPLLGPMIKHPLVYSVLVGMPNMVEHLNRGYEHKREELAKAIAAKNWRTAIWLHERAYRGVALARFAPHIESDQDYWSLVTDFWMDSENIHEEPDLWDNLLHADRGSHEAMMDQDERDTLAELPDRFTVYQGHTDLRDDGWSWTLNRDKAIWFARRFAGFDDALPVLSSTRVDKANVHALLLGRGEDEVLIDPRLVRKRVAVPLDPAD
jgi:hypothetical protein